MTIALFIVGVMLAMFGGLMSFGVAIGILEGTSKYSMNTDLVGLIIFGITPIVSGLWLCRRYMPRSPEDKVIAPKKANKNFDLSELFFESETPSDSEDPPASEDPFDSDKP